jgi:hypothetical protein
MLLENIIDELVLLVLEQEREIKRLNQCIEVYEEVIKGE